VGQAGEPLPAMPISVLSSRPHGATVVAQLQGYTVREEVEALRAHTVSVSRAQFPAAEDDEYYWIDLIGCRLMGELNGEPTLIGEVLDVTDNGAHAVLKVGRASLDSQGNLVFARDKNGRVVDILVPFVEAHIQHVDLNARRIDSDWPADF